MVIPVDMSLLFLTLILYSSLTFVLLSISLRTSCYYKLSSLVSMFSLIRLYSPVRVSSPLLFIEDGDLLLPKSI